MKIYFTQNYKNCTDIIIYKNKQLKYSVICTNNNTNIRKIKQPLKIKILSKLIIKM